MIGQGLSIEVSSRCFSVANIVPCPQALFREVMKNSWKRVKKLDVCTLFLSEDSFKPLAFDE